MSFSKDVKEELSKISNLANKELVKAELIGYLVTNNVDIKNNKIKYSTESEYNINRFSKLISNVGIKNFKIDIQGKVFSIYINEKLNIEEIEIRNNVIMFNEKILNFCNNDLIERAIVRGTFLGSGSINNPENKYHLEVWYNCYENMEFIEKLLSRNNINVKKINNSIYIKDGEEISKYLAFIGANKAVLKFEEIRVIRDMRNNVNRLVNCETANLNKTINAALKQIDDINFIIKCNRFSELSENLQEIAQIRLDNPDASLIELGKMLNNPIGKSGVNYRLKMICDFAEELRNKGK